MTGDSLKIQSEREARFNKKIAEAHCCFIGIGVLLLTGLLAMYVSALVDPLWLDTSGQTFQRSGAISTIATIIASIQLTRLYTSLCGSGGFGCDAGTRAYKQVEPYFCFIRFFTTLITIGSTIVWGYGDVIYRAISNQSL